MERVRFGTYDFLPSTGELRRAVAVRIRFGPTSGPSTTMTIVDGPLAVRATR